MDWRKEAVEDYTLEEAAREWDELRRTLPERPPVDEREEWLALEFRLFLLAIRAGRFDPEVVGGRADQPAHPRRKSATDDAWTRRVVRARRAELMGRSAVGEPKPVSELPYSDAEREYFALAEALPHMAGHPKRFSALDGDPEALLEDYAAAERRHFLLSIRVGAEDERLDEIERVIARRRAFCAPYVASEAAPARSPEHPALLSVEPREEHAYVTKARTAAALVATFEAPNPEHVNAIAILTAALIQGNAATAAAEIVATSIGHATAQQNEQTRRADVANVASLISSFNHARMAQAYHELAKAVRGLLRATPSQQGRIEAAIADMLDVGAAQIATRTEFEALPETERAKVTEHVREMHRMVTGRLRDA